jgi:tRNA-modifying protein YgfZ
MDDALRARLDAEGAVWGEVAGRAVARRFADPAAEYAAVRSGAGVAVRSDLAVFRLWGRDPVRMVNGLITNDLAAAAKEGRGCFGAMLTPKGRAVAELRAFRRSAAEGEELLVLVHAEAAAGTAEHLRKYVPPMFARWEDASDAIGVVGVYGPAAAARVRAVLGTLPPGAAEDAMAEAVWEGAWVIAARTLDAGGEDGYDLIAPAAALAALRDALLGTPGSEDAARAVGFGTFETLRVEAGRPRYGAELDDGTIPTEAYQESGLLERAVSFTKGCYTGQEVIVRIAHRGHVNRHLRGLLLGEHPAPAPRTPLFRADTGREVGWTASAALSPSLGQTVALGYVRREVEPGGEVRLGAPDGPPVGVARLPFPAAAG